MSSHAAADAAAELRSKVREQTNDFILMRTRIGMGVLLLANFLFAMVDSVFWHIHAFSLIALRLVLGLLVVVLWRIGRPPRAREWAVPLALVTVALATVQALGVGIVRGDVTTAVVLTIGLGACVSTVLPWGAWAQLGAVATTGLATVVMIWLRNGMLDSVLVYPATAAGLAFGVSLYAAHVLRRYFTSSIEREIGLRASHEQIRHQLSQLDALYQAAPLGLALIDVDLRYLRVNQALADMNGVRPEDHIGRTVREILPESTADTVEPLCRGVMATGRPLVNVELIAATEGQRGVMREWRGYFWPVRDRAGAVVAVSCAVQEITEQRRVQETLRQNAERLQLVSEAANNAVWDWDLSTDNVWWNERINTLFGYAAAAVGPTIRWWSDNIHPQDRTQIAAGVRALLDSRERHFSVEYRFRRADGSYAHVFDRGSVVHDADGKPVRIVGAMTDISRRKHAEQALARLNDELERRVAERTAQLEAANQQLECEIAERRQAAAALLESQKQLQDILDNTTAVIYLKDTDGRYLLVNLRFESLFHVRREQICGKTDYDFLPRAVADEFRANDMQVLAGNRAINFEEAVPHDDGLYTYVSVKFPLRDANGVPRGVCGISTDITARKQMESELRASQAQLSALVEHTSDAIWSIDRQHRLTGFNSTVRQLSENAHGKPLKVGDPFDVPEEEREYWRPLYDRTLAGEGSVFERQFPMAGGELRSYLISMTPIVTEGEVTGATIYAKDITDLRRAEESARRHQAELTHVLRVGTVGEMAAGLAHEINQPLGAIANYAQGCRLRIASGSARADELLPALDEIANQALRAGEIIRRLRQLVQKGKSPHERADLNAIVAEAAHVIEPQVQHQGATLRIDLAPGLDPVEVDRIQIEQVILNLMLNGLEAMQTTNGGQPELTVSTTAAGDGKVEVVIRDTGVGLKPDISENMFEPFFTSKPSGLGMGLAISRSIVEEHGGRIWATNNGDGDHGATFHVVLPVVRPDGSAVVYAPGST